MSHRPQITYYVIIGKQPADVGSAVRPISRLVDEEEEQIRQKLLTPSFEVLRRFAKKANAEGLRNQLHALGVESLLISDQEIRSHLILFAASASKGSGGLAFRDFADQPLYCPWEDITSVLVLDLETESGGSATFIDLIRQSTRITPRLDTALFDFATLSEGGDQAEFLTMVAEKSGASIDRQFGQHALHMKNLAKDFGTLPGMFEPPEEVLPSKYSKEFLRAANVYSFLKNQTG